MSAESFLFFPSAPSLCFDCWLDLVLSAPPRAYQNQASLLISIFWFIDFFCRYHCSPTPLSLLLCILPRRCSFASQNLNFIGLDVSFLFPVSWYTFRSATLAVVGLFSSFDLLAVIWFWGVFFVFPFWDFICWLRNWSQLCSGWL